MRSACDGMWLASFRPNVVIVRTTLMICPNKKNTDGRCGQRGCRERRHRRALAQDEAQ